MTKAKWRKWFLRTCLAMVAAIALFVVVFVAVVELTPFDASKLTRTSEPTVVYARDGSVYMTIASSGAHDLTYDQIPKNLRDAVVAVEDHNFWTSSGVDIKGLLRAAFVDLWSGSLAQGGSTIQMQLAKIVYLNDKKTLGRKLQQMVLGVQIDRYFTKKEILAMYLNRVFLGENCVGVQEAAWRYFGIDLKQHPEQLTLDQAALLAGLPQAPSAYDPLQHPEAALKRRNEVLEQMAKYGYITEKQAKEAESKPLGHLVYHKLPGDAWDNHPLFTNFLFDYAARAGIDQEELLQGGLKIYTTVDPKVQASIDQVFWSTNYNYDFPGPTTGTVVQGAALFADPKTGGILGGAGSRRQGWVPFGLDRIYSLQQPGSSIKPVLEYGAAIESGQWGPDSILDNHEQDFGGYRPRNDDPNAPPRMTLRDALATSQNVAAVWLLQQIGIDKGAEFAERLGIPLTDEDKRNLGIAVGGLQHGVNTMQMAKAYAAFANKGVQMDLYLIKKIVNQSGDTIYEFNPGAKRVMSERTAAIMTQLLEGVVQRGTGVAAQVPGWGVAGKTGTVQYDPELRGAHLHWVRTAWFDGYTPTMVGSIYIGYDQPSPEHHMTDYPYFPSHYAAKIFGDIVKLATAGEPPQQFDYGGVFGDQQQPAVQNLKATWDPNLNAVQLTWTSPLQGQVNFVVKRSGPTPAGAQPGGGAGAGQNGDFVLLGETDQTTFEDPNVQPGMSYTYLVQAIDPTSGQPMNSAQTITVTIQQSAPPGGPDNSQNSVPGTGPDNGIGNPGSGTGNSDSGNQPPPGTNSDNQNGGGGLGNVIGNLMGNSPPNSSSGNSSGTSTGNSSRSSTRNSTGNATGNSPPQGRH
jgi:penicillin-binding protein 2A